MQPNKKPIYIILTIFVIIYGIAFYTEKQKNTPEKTIQAFIQAINSKNLISFEKYTDIEKIAIDIASMISTANTADSKQSEIKAHIIENIKNQINGGIEKSLEKTGNEGEFYTKKIFNPLYVINLNLPKNTKYIKTENTIAYAELIVSQNAQETSLEIKMQKINNFWQVIGFYNKDLVKKAYTRYQEMKMLDSIKKINDLNISAINQVMEMLVDDNHYPIYKINGDFPSGDIKALDKYLGVIPGAVLKEYFPNGGLKHPMFNSKYHLTQGKVDNP